eukprot:s2855_g1.t1
MHDAPAAGSAKRGRSQHDTEFTFFRELGMPSLKDEVVFVELCAGSGILSATAEEHGFFPFPVDHDRNRHQSFTQIFSLDLTEDKAWTFLDLLRESATVVAWHLGLPCGTCSRAREIPINEYDAGPPPLRNEQYPMGVPWMNARDAAKVRQANHLYERACQFVLQLLFMLHVVTIENPTDSWLWTLPCVAALYQYCFFVNFHACMFGGKRKKRTSLLTNETRFQALPRFCDESHEHAAWGLDETGTFNTAHEAQYPKGLCEEYCKILVDINNSNSSSPSTQETTPVVNDGTHFRAHVQPRGRKIKQLVPEFLRVVSLVLPNLPSVNGKKLLTQPLFDIPAGSKLLRSEAKQGSYLCVFGIFHSIQQFVMASQQLLHPFDSFVNLPDILLQCMFDVLTLGPIEIAKLRLSKIQSWRRRREELEKAEREVHGRIPQHMKLLVQDKQFLLFEQLAEEIGWPDKTLHHEMRTGFKLVGQGTPSNVFKPEVKLAKFDEQELMRQSKFLRPLILGKVKNAGLPEYGKELNDITRGEADSKGWLKGPLDEESLRKEVGDHWLPVERFAVGQRNKLRPIDNFSSNKVNEAWTSPEKLDLQALDHMIWLIGVFYKCAVDKRVVDLSLSDGRQLQGPVHDDWHRCSNECLLTTLDLKDAYKHLGVHESDRNKAVVTLKSDVHGGVDCYAMNCLPFGAASSVHNFNRVARLLWAIGVVELRLPWVNYFDDYPLMTPSSISTSTVSAAKSMMHILGFKYAEHKLETPKESAEILGVNVDCSGVRSLGEVKYIMKESRRVELLECLENILKEKAIVPFDLPSILGRVQFADGQLTGRAGKLAMADDTLRAVEFLRKRFLDNEPRKMSLKCDDHPILLFTDGSFEPGGDEESALIGGVLLCEGMQCRVFGSHVPPELLEKWHAAGKEHLIGQVEMYAVAVARALWKQVLQ